MRKVFLSIAFFILTLTLPVRATENAIVIRKQGMQAAERTMSVIKRSIRISDFDEARLSSKSILEWANVMRDYFPIGSGASIDNFSAASDEIWGNFTLFDSFISNKKVSAKKMITAAINKDKKQLRKAFIETQDTCNACHNRFRN